jgi:hypothetical protein
MGVSDVKGDRGSTVVLQLLLQRADLALQRVDFIEQFQRQRETCRVEFEVAAQALWCGSCATAHRCRTATIIVALVGDRPDDAVFDHLDHDVGMNAERSQIRPG